MNIYYGHHGKAVLSIHECHQGDFFLPLERTDPWLWSVDSYKSYDSSIHEYSLRKPWKRYASFVSVATIYTNTKYSCKATGVKSRSQVPRRNAKGMPSKLAASHQGILGKNYMYLFFLLKSSFQQSRCKYSVFRHVCQICPLINILLKQNSHYFWLLFENSRNVYPFPFTKFRRSCNL